ncbi:MAG TPA: hypothetical protein VMW17_12510 [Candidatus Binatia bacterium]|nr:hypothetical protein [Candidatus Binatia bacterium]
MRLRWLLTGVICVLSAEACRRPAPTPAPASSAFRDLERVAISADNPLPSGDVRLTGDIVEVGVSSDGTYLVVTEPEHKDERLILVYGTPADVVFAKYAQGQRMEIAFKVVGQTALADGRPAIRISIWGMQTAGAPTPTTP